jgi:hypothetical protein
MKIDNIDFDAVKSRRNDFERGLSFDLVYDFDWSSAVTRQDLRKDYGEDRYISTLPHEGKFYVVCFTFRGDVLRVISLRRANAREVKDYEQKRATAID